jgi:hypothetical protein
VVSILNINEEVAEEEEGKKKGYTSLPNISFLAIAKRTIEYI